MEKYLITEKLSQTKLRSKFNFLNPEIQHKITMSIWHYMNPQIVNKGSKVYSNEKSFTDEIIKRINLNSYREYISDSQINKIKNIIKGLNLDANWEYDDKAKSFIKK